MSDLFVTVVPSIDAFHFLRPLWLLLLLPLLIIWWLNQPSTARQENVHDRIAPHLRRALTVSGTTTGRFKPIDHVVLVLALATVGAAGPTWTRQVDPFLAQTGPVVVVLEVTQSMTTPDLHPDRLERAKYKIRDLLELRPGARTALIAYSGSAHRVLPLTEDAQIIVPYLEGLDPEIMPLEGANASTALDLAVELLSDEPGGILFILDGLEMADATALDNSSDVPITVLAMLPSGTAVKDHK